MARLEVDNDLYGFNKQQHSAVDNADATRQPENYYDECNASSVQRVVQAPESPVYEQAAVQADNPLYGDFDRKGDLLGTDRVYSNINFDTR